jgi:hypothetical protein
MNRKVLDLTTLYNFYKGSIVFFSTDFAQIAAKLWMSLCLGEQELLAVDQFFHPFPLKIWKAIQHESCALEKLDNFRIGRCWVFRWNLENAAKVPEVIWWHQGFSGVWPCFWPRVDHKGVLTWSRGSLGVGGSVFEVMTQVDLGLTNVSRFDLADPSINVNEAN